MTKKDVARNFISQRNPDADKPIYI